MISCAITMQLICAVVIACAKSEFSGSFRLLTILQFLITEVYSKITNIHYYKLLSLFILSLLSIEMD